MAISLDDLLADEQEPGPKPKQGRIRLDDLLTPQAPAKVRLDDLLGSTEAAPAAPPAPPVANVGLGTNDLLAATRGFGMPQRTIDLEKPPAAAVTAPTTPARKSPLLPVPDYGSGIVKAGGGKTGAIMAGVAEALTDLVLAPVKTVITPLQDVFSPSTPEEAANPLQQAARMRAGQSIPEVQAGVHEARRRVGEAIPRPGERTLEMVKSLPRMGYDIQSAMMPGPNLGNLLYDELTGQKSSQELIESDPQGIAAQFEPKARAAAFTMGVGLPIALGMGAHSEYARGLNPDAARGIGDRLTGRYPKPPAPPPPPPAQLGAGHPLGRIGPERQIGTGEARFREPLERFGGDQPTPTGKALVPRGADRRVAELEEQLAQERRVSRTEPRTGLGNALQLREAEAGNPTHHWGAIDVVGLKGLNDKVSYEAGSELINQVARAMKQAATELGIPPQHVHFSGGDEGWVNHESPDVVARFGERVRELVPTTTIPGTSYPTGVRVGTGPSRVAADEAVRQAKEGEKGRYVRPEYQRPEGERRGIERAPDQQDIVRFPTSAIKAKPETYQFKQLGASGVSGELKNVTKFNEELGGAISVWREPDTGDVVVINGHHRLDLAKRLGHPSLNVHFIKAGSVEEARAKGAFQNIAEGRGTPLDVAKFLRDTKVTPDALRARGVSLDARLANDGLHLSKLAPDLFDQVATGKVKMGWGVAIGEMVKSPDLQRQTLAAATAARPRLTTAEVRELARAVQSAGAEQVEQGGLFGGTQDESLYIHRARLAALIQKRLAGDKRLFGFIAKEGRASELERAGETKIDVNAAQDIAGQSAQIQELFSRLYTRSGPIADVMTAGARRVANGEKASTVARDLYPAIGQAVEAELRNTPAGGVSGLGGGGVERPEAPRPVPPAPPEAPVAPGPDLTIDEASPYADNEGNEEPFLAGARDEYHGYLGVIEQAKAALESGKSPYTNRKLTAKQRKAVESELASAEQMAADILEEIRATFGNEVADALAKEAESFPAYEPDQEPATQELVRKLDEEAAKDGPQPKTKEQKRLRALSDDEVQAEADALVAKLEKIKDLTAPQHKPLWRALDDLRVELAVRRPGGLVPYPGTESDINVEYLERGFIENTLVDEAVHYQPTPAGQKRIRDGEPHYLPSDLQVYPNAIRLDLRHVTDESLVDLQERIESLFEDAGVQERIKRNPGLVELLELDNDAIARERRIRRGAEADINDELRKLVDEKRKQGVPSLRERYPDASDDAIDAIHEAGGDIQAAIDALEFDDARGTGYKSDDARLREELEELLEESPKAPPAKKSRPEMDEGDEERRGLERQGLEERYPNASESALTVLEENGGDIDAAIKALEMEEDDARGNGYTNEEVLFELQDLRDAERGRDSQDPDQGTMFSKVEPDAGRTAPVRSGFELTSEPTGPEQPSMFGEREGTPAARNLAQAEAAARAKIDLLRQRIQLTTDPERLAKLKAELAQQLKLVNRGQGISAEEASAEAASTEQPRQERGQQDLFANRIPGGEKAEPNEADRGTPEMRAEARGGRGKAGSGRKPPSYPVAVDEALAGQRGILGWLQHTFSPASMTMNSKWTAAMIRDVDARREARVVRAYESLRTVAGAFDRMPIAERMDFIYRMEAGDPQPTPQLTWFAETLRRLLDAKRDAIQNLGTGKLETFYEHYFPHLWKDPRRAGSWIARFLGNRPLEGSKAFLKERSVPTVKAGVEMGLEPATTNPVDLVMLKLAEMDKYLAAQDIIQNLKRNKLARFVSVFSKIPEGYSKYNDPTSTVWGPPTIQVSEAFDALVRKGLNERIAAIRAAKGIKHTRKVNIGAGPGVLGWADMGPMNEMQTKFGGPDSVIMHELGHLLDKHWQLWSRLMDAPGKTRAAIDLRKRLHQEMRDLADLRVEGTHPDDVSKSHRRYLHNKQEKVANAVTALLYAPEKMAAVAPTIKARLEGVFKGDPLLKPLLDIKPSLTLGVGVAEQPVGGLPVRGYWVVPNTVATVLNNHLSAGLASNPLFSAYRNAGNVLNMAQLGLSAFHLGFTSLDAMISKTAIGIRYLEHGQLLQAAKNFAQMPAAAVTNFLQGRALYNAYLNPTQVGPEMAQILDGLLKGGGRIQMDPFYRLGASRRFLEALRGVPTRVQIGTGPGGAPKYDLVPKRSPGQALVNALPAFFEQTSRWLMEYIVPRQKLGVFMDMYRFELARLGPNATDAQVRAAAVKVWNSVDNRMGQLVYNNLFWHRTLKDLGMASVRSLGWNLGSVSEVGGGLVDTATMPKRAWNQRGPRFGGKDRKPFGEGTESLLTHKQAYIVAMVFTVGLFNAIVQYLYTGQPPREAKDLFFPRTGRKTPEGDDERLSPASYIRDIASVAHGGVNTITHKLHPLLSFMVDMFQNEDFFGNQLRNPNAPAVVQLKQLMEAAAGEFAPFSIQQYVEERRRGQSQAAATSSFFGLTPAPRYAVRTPAKNRMADILRTRSAHGLAPEDVAAARKRGQLTQDLRNQTPGAAAELEGAMQSGDITTGQATRMLGRLTENPVVERFKQLTPAEAVEVFALANDEERQLWIAPMLTKMNNAAAAGDVVPVRQFAELMKRKPMATGAGR